LKESESLTIVAAATVFSTYIHRNPSAARHFYALMSKSPHPEQSPGPQSDTSSSGISKEIKIGIIVGIVIVVILTLIAVGYCLLDGRRRMRTWREKRSARADADCNMLQAELENGRTARRDSNTGGLWDRLRVSVDATRRPPDALTNGGQRSRAGDSGSGPVEIAEAPRRVRFSEEVHIRQQNGSKEDVVERVIPALVTTGLPTQRESMISSVGSSGVPTPSSPVVANSFLDREIRR
jgi:hypothetical protein